MEKYFASKKLVQPVTCNRLPIDLDDNGLLRKEHVPWASALRSLWHGLLLVPIRIRRIFVPGSVGAQGAHLEIVKLKERKRRFRI